MSSCSGALMHILFEINTVEGEGKDDICLMHKTNKGGGLRVVERETLNPKESE